MTRFRICLAVGVGLTAAWLAACGLYVTREVGWDAMGFMLPHELAAFIAGVFMPLAFLWFALVWVLSLPIEIERQLFQQRFTTVPTLLHDASEAPFKRPERLRDGKPVLL